MVTLFHLGPLTNVALALRCHLTHIFTTFIKIFRLEPKFADMPANLVCTQIIT